MSQVGKTLKTLIIILLIIGLIICAILFFIGNAAYQDDKDYMKYATVYGNPYGSGILQEAGDNAYYGLQLRNMSLILAGTLIVCTIPLYSIAVLVENSEQQTALLSKLVNTMTGTGKQQTALLSNLVNTMTDTEKTTGIPPAAANTITGTEKTTGIPPAAAPVVVTPHDTNAAEYIKCPVCEKVQRANRTVCWECGAQLKKG